MAKEKLIIKNFAGFEHIEFDFKPINVFIGPQAAGKSIVIKLAYFFKSYLEGVGKLNSLPFEQYDQYYQKIFFKYFPSGSWNDKEFEITYSIEDKISITVKGGKYSVMNINFSPFMEIFKQTVTDGIELFKKAEDDTNSLKSRHFIGKEALRIRSSFKLPKVLEHIQYFIPAGRSFFSNVQSNIFSLLQNENSLDPFLLEFGSYYEHAKDLQDFIDSYIEDDDNFKSVNKISSDIIKGNYTQDEGQDFIAQQDGRKINLLNASSGQQEALPLILFLQSIINSHLSTLYIEEPEAHLYPDAQKKMVQLLARVYNSANSQLFITTHSPYILAAFNNLIEASNIIKNKPELAEKVYNIIPKEEVIKVENLIAYSIKDGKRTVLLDEENNLISQNILDDVSNEIGAEFGKLLDLEFGE
ncbi:AAA family ATPase [Dysgonomonas alginatilytica]|nr:ATP-binding protein [Dysgonomonas alginatilytica]